MGTMHQAKHGTRKLLYSILTILLLTTVIIQGVIQVSAAPVPNLTSDSSLLTPFLGQEVSICYTPENGGDENGFRPVLELVIPQGLTFKSADYLGIEVSGEAFTIPPSGELEYDIGRYKRTVTGEPGSTVEVLFPPINHIAPGESVPPICVTLQVEEDAEIGKDYVVNGTLIFAYGSDQFDNPNEDPPQVSPKLEVTVRPNLLKVRKELGEGIWSRRVVPTGPNYAFNYSLVVSLALGEFSDLIITDHLPQEAVFVRIVGIKNLTSGGWLSYSDYEILQSPNPGDYGGDLRIKIPRVRGNSGDTLEVLISMYFPFYDSGGGELIGFSSPKNVGNDVDASVVYNENTYTVSNHTEVTASSSTYLKTVSMYRDNYASGLSHYDILEYTIYFYLSDYYNISVLTLQDTLGDGQRVLSNMTPVFYVVNGSNTYTGSFPSDAYTFGADHSGPGGTTPLFFNVTRALEETGSERNLTGGMVGDESWSYNGGDFEPPFGRGRTWGYVKFWALVEKEYYSTVPSGDQTLDSGDSVRNEVLATTTWEGVRFNPPDVGRKTKMAIKTPRLEKSIAYVNGVPPSGPVQVKAGDEVTFRLKVKIPTGNADSLNITDMLPLPVFRVDYDEGQTPFSVGQSPSSQVPPPPGQWAIGPDDNVTSTTGLEPVLFLVDNTANELGFRYSEPIHTESKSLLVVDIMYTLTVTDYPFDDMLRLANMATLNYGNSSKVPTTAYSPTEIITQSPHLTIDKRVIESTGGEITQEGDLEGADAADTVTFQVNVTNEGHWEAHDVVIRDDIQPSAEHYYENLQDLQVLKCDGLTLWDSSAYTLTVYPDTTTPQYLELSFNDNYVLPSGECVVIRYKLTLASDVEPLQKYVNNGSITSYASIEGGDNFVDPNDPPSDDATVTVAPPELEKSVSWTSNADTQGDDLTIGEEVEFKVEVTLPEGIIEDMVIEDDWPEGFKYLSYTIDTTGFSGTLPTPTVTVDEVNRKIRFEFTGTTVVNPDNDPDNNAFTITLKMRVLDDQSNVGYPPHIKKNHVALEWDDKQVEGEKSVRIVEPHLVVTKEFNATSADASDWLRVTLTLTNNGYSKAYEVNLSDTLDLDVFDPSSVTEVETPLGFTFTYNPSSGEIKYLGGDVDDGETLTFKFDVKVKDSVTTMGTLVNTAIAEGSSMEGRVDDERTYQVSGQDTLQIGEISRSKVLVETSEPSTSGKYVTIGEIVYFNLTASIPEGTTKEVSFIDELPVDSSSQILLQPMEAEITVNKEGVTSTEVTLTPSSWNSISGTLQGNIWRFDLGDVTNTNSDPEPEKVTIRVKLLVLNREENSAGKQLVNKFRVGYRNRTGDYEYTPDVEADLIVSEPQLWSILTADPISVGWAGDEVTLQFNLTNLDVATSETAFDLDLWCTLPSELSDLQIIEIDTSTSGVGAISDQSTGDELRLEVEYLEPGAWVNVTFKVILQPNAVFGQEIPLQCTANGTTTPGEKGSWNGIPGNPGEVDGERTGDGTGPNDITTSDDASVTVGTPNVNKDVLTPKARYAPGDVVKYQITVGTPKGSTDDLRVEDELGEGLSYVAGSLDVGTPSGVTYQNTPAETAPFFSYTDTGTVELLTFDFGSFTNYNSGGVNTYIKFDAVVEDSPHNSDGVSLTNEASLVYVDVNGEEQTVGPVQKSILVGEPLLDQLSKEFLSNSFTGGQTVWFTVTFRNSGTAPAYDTVLVDILPPELRGGTPTLGSIRVGDRTLSSGDYFFQYFSDNGTIRIELLTPDENSRAVIQPGEDVEIVLGAKALDHVPMSYEAVNEFRIREYSSRPGEPDQERTYSGGTATASIKTPDPVVEKVVHSTRTPPPDPSDPTRSEAVVGEVIFYNVTFRMPQGTVAYDVEFYDLIPDGLEPINATARGINGTSVVVGTTSITESGGRYHVTASFGKLVGAEVNVTIYARVSYYYSDGTTPVREGDVLIDGNSTNECYYSWSNGEVQRTYSNQVETTILGSSADLTITKEFSPPSARLGSRVHAIIEIRNVGSGTSYNTILRDVLCPSFRYVDANVTPDSVAGNEIVWNIGELDPGEGWAVNLSLDLVECGCLNNNATVSWVNPGDPSDYRERRATAEIKVTPDLILTKNVEPHHLEVGGKAVVKLSVHNLTCGTAYKLNFTDLLPPGLEYVPGSSYLNGSAIPDPQQEGSLLTWNTSLTLNGGESYLLTFLVKAVHSIGNGVNYAEVNAYDVYSVPVSANDTDTVSAGKASVRISKEFDRREAPVNGTLRVTITIKNEGSDPAYDLEVWDILPCCLEYAGGSTVGGSRVEPEKGTIPPGWRDNIIVTKNPELQEKCKGNRPLVWHISRLDPGESITITFEVRVRCSGILRNVAEVYYRNIDGSIAGFDRDDAIMLAYSSPRAATHSTPSVSRTHGGGWTDPTGAEMPALGVDEGSPSFHSSSQGNTQAREEKGASEPSQEFKRTINESSGAASSETLASGTTTSNRPEVVAGTTKPADKRSKLENLYMALAISIGAFLAILLYASYYYLRRRAQGRRG